MPPPRLLEVMRVNLGEQQCGVLIVSPTDQLRPAAVDRHGVTDDVSVEGAQQGVGQMLAFDRPLGEQAVILGDIFRMAELVIAKIRPPFFMSPLWTMSWVQ